MGKKTGKKRPIAEIEEDVEDIEDEELAAELAALEAMKSEQSSSVVDHNKSSYNKEALLKYVENLESGALPFAETLQIGHFSIEVTDENDDLEREVLLHYFVSHKLYMCM
jgi:hypothetical protein